jgi:hypothetical protein
MQKVKSSSLFSRSQRTFPRSCSALINLRLTQPLAQSRKRNPKIPGDMRDRTTGLKHHPDPALDQLLRTLSRT